MINKLISREYKTQEIRAWLINVKIIIHKQKTIESMTLYLWKYEDDFVSKAVINVIILKLTAVKQVWITMLYSSIIFRAYSTWK